MGTWALLIRPLHARHLIELFTANFFTGEILDNRAPLIPVEAGQQADMDFHTRT
jgi:hypothetical protein